MSSMTRHSWDLADPARLVEEIAEAVPLLVDTAHVALVEDPARSQVLLKVETLPTPARINHHDDVRHLLVQAVRDRLSVPPLVARGSIRHVLVTVVVRDGLTVMTRNEAQWLKAWRYSNHMTSAYDSHLILVTEHGWYDWVSRSGAAEPRVRLPDQGAWMTPSTL